MILLDLLKISTDFYNHSNTATKIISLMFALYFQEMPFIYPVLRALRLKGMAGNLANI